MSTTTGTRARTSGTRRATVPVLHAALVCTALMAGLFSTWDISVMPGLALLDDRAFVTAMQALDVAIYNPAFVLLLLGALVLTALAALLARGDGSGAARWAVAGLGLYVVALVVTSAVHLPLNAALGAVDTLGPDAELARARAAFEGPWRSTNPVRTLACVLALLCLARALSLTRPTT